MSLTKPDVLLLCANVVLYLCCPLHSQIFPDKKSSYVWTVEVFYSDPKYGVNPVGCHIYIVFLYVFSGVFSKLENTNMIYEFTKYHNK